MNISRILETLYPDIQIGEQGAECSIAMGADGTPYIETWRRVEKQPTLEDLKAAEPAALAAEQAKAAERQEADTARADAKRALSHLDTIIAGAPTATTAQLRAAVEQLARIQKHVILAVVGR